MAAQARMDEPG